MKNAIMTSRALGMMKMQNVYRYVYTSLVLGKADVVSCLMSPWTRKKLTLNNITALIRIKNEIDITNIIKTGRIVLLLLCFPGSIAQRQLYSRRTITINEPRRKWN